MRHYTALTSCLAVVCLMLFDGVAAAEIPKRVVLPDKVAIPAITGPDGVTRTWTAIESKFKAGDPFIREWVSLTMKRVKVWTDRPDSYYLGLFRPESPFGRDTICCPFHPQMTGWMPFDWDPDHPWRLTCPLCKKEGRKPDYYPNKLYPDDGKGCRPTDEVWRKTHTPEWSAKYNIPWEKWDGHTYGNVDGFAYHFLGFAQFRIFFEINWRRDILGNLCRGYAFGTRFYPAGSAERKLAGACAHKAKLIMVTMARTIMGDPYLREVLQADPQQYRNAIRALAVGADGKALPYKEYPGYERRDVISDHSVNDPKHPLETVRSYWKPQFTIFPDRPLTGWAREWLKSYAMIQDSFTPAERKAELTDLIERLLVSKAGDAERLKKTGRPFRRGIIEYSMQPYDLTMRSNNLAGSIAWSNLNLGFMLKDQHIVRNVADDIWYFLRNYFNGDGLGFQVTPFYSRVALSGLNLPLGVLNGMSEGFGPGDAFWDPKTKSLNAYMDPVMAANAYGLLLSALPDGRCAPWTDSQIVARPDMGLIEKVANATGGVPERFRPWLDISRDDQGKFHITLKKQAVLPSYVLGISGLAVMRTGTGPDQTFVSVDWSRLGTGHCHKGSFNLLLYGAGHEMLFEQGYLNNVTLAQAWMGSAEAHNTALVRSDNGSAAKCIRQRGSLRFFADTPQVKAAEVAEKGVMYQRTVVLMTAESPYVVDIFRLQGGSLHDYYVHSLGDTFALSGATLKPEVDPKKSLYDVSGFKYRTSTGAKVITGISRAGTDGTFTLTWRDMKDWRTVPPEIDADAVTRVRVLAMPGTEILVGKTFGQRYRDGRDVAARVTVACIRRKAEAFGDMPDAFVAVIDAVRGKADKIKQVRQLKVLSGDKAGVGVKIVRPGGVDYVLSTTRDDVATTFADSDSKEKITLTGRLGVVQADTGKPASLLLVQGKHLVFGKRSVDAAATTLKGRLVGFNNRTIVLTVESDAAIPTGTELAGRVMIVRHNRKATAFTIRRIDRIAPGRYDIALANTVNLAEWTARVKSVKDNSIALEPATGRLQKRGLFLYRTDAAGQAILLGPFVSKYRTVLDEHGTMMARYVTATLAKTEGLKPASRVLISTLHVGKDTVSIPVISRLGGTTRTDEGSRQDK